MKKNQGIMLAMIGAIVLAYLMGFADGQESAYIKMANKKNGYSIQKHYKGE